MNNGDYDSMLFFTIGKTSRFLREALESQKKEKNRKRKNDLKISSFREQPS